MLTSRVKPDDFASKSIKIHQDSWGSVVNWLKSIESIGRKNGNKPNFPWLLKHPWSHQLVAFIKSSHHSFPRKMIDKFMVGFSNFPPSIRMVKTMEVTMRSWSCHWIIVIIQSESWWWDVEVPDFLTSPMAMVFFCLVFYLDDQLDVHYCSHREHPNGERPLKKYRIKTIHLGCDTITRYPEVLECIYILKQGFFPSKKVFLASAL